MEQKGKSRRAKKIHSAASTAGLENLPLTTNWCRYLTALAEEVLRLADRVVDEGVIDQPVLDQIAPTASEAPAVSRPGYKPCRGFGDLRGRCERPAGERMTPAGTVPSLCSRCDEARLQNEADLARRRRGDEFAAGRLLAVETFNPEFGMRRRARRI
jgi:hypothetical protein